MRHSDSGRIIVEQHDRYDPVLGFLAQIELFENSLLNPPNNRIALEPVVWDYLGDLSASCLTSKLEQDVRWIVRIRADSADIEVLISCEPPQQQVSDV